MKSSNQEMFAVSLSPCSRYYANFKFDQSLIFLFMTVRYILTSVRMTTRARSPTPAIIDELWTLLMLSLSGGKYTGGISTLALRSPPLARRLSHISGEFALITKQKS